MPSETRSSSVARATHVDQVDVVAHLGDDRAGDGGIQHGGERLRAQAEPARLVLVDLDAHLAGRLVPVEIDAPRVGAGRHHLGELERDLAHLVHVRAADAILHRPADRRPELERRDPRDRARKVLGQHLLQLGLQPLARVDILGDDHRLGEELVRQLDVQRQVEADRALADIGAPALDVGVAREHAHRAARPWSRWHRSRRCAAASDRPPARAGRRPGRTAAARSGWRTAPRRTGRR